MFCSVQFWVVLTYSYNLAAVKTDFRTCKWSHTDFSTTVYCHLACKLAYGPVSFQVVRILAPNDVKQPKCESLMESGELCGVALSRFDCPMFLTIFLHCYIALRTSYEVFFLFQWYTDSKKRRVVHSVNVGHLHLSNDNTLTDIGQLRCDEFLTGSLSVAHTLNVSV